MNLTPTVNSHLFSKKNTNAVKRQERFENSLKLQEEYLKGLK